MPTHPTADQPPLVPALGADEEVWGVVRSTTDVLVGTDRRIFRIRPDGVDEWPLDLVHGVYPSGTAGVYLLAADAGSVAIAIPPGPDEEDSVQALTVIGLLVGLAHRPAGRADGAGGDAVRAPGDPVGASGGRDGETATAGGRA